MTPDGVDQPRGRAPGSPGLDAPTRSLVHVAVAVRTSATPTSVQRLTS